MKSFFKNLFDKKMLITFLMGFSSGVPLLLASGDTIKAYMTDANVDLKTIGLFSAVGLPYTYKFLWAPFMDRYPLPLLGLRRGWMIFTQILLIIPIFLMGSIDPVINTWWIALLAVSITFLSASQDIVIDAYRRELFYKEDEKLGLAASYYTIGYRVAMLVTGAGAFYIAEYLSWKTCYQIMAGLMSIGIIATIFAPNIEKVHAIKHTLMESVVGPFKEYFKRRGAIEMLMFILLYKLGDNLASAMATPFYMKLGFSKPDIASIVKIAGVIATLVGGYLGGVGVLKLGTKKALVWFGLLQMVSTFVFSYLAMKGQDYGVLTFTIMFENFTGGLGTAAYAGFMASITSVQFTATQYALLTSLMAIPRVIFGSSTGYLAENLGWVNYFILCGAIAIPGLLLILRFNKWEKAD